MDELLSLRPCSSRRLFKAAADRFFAGWFQDSRFREYGRDQESGSNIKGGIENINILGDVFSTGQPPDFVGIARLDGDILAVHAGGVDGT
jgi:hypothetical protein